MSLQYISFRKIIIGMVLRSLLPAFMTGLFFSPPLLANGMPVTKPSELSGSIIIGRDNRLRVIKETIEFNISKKDYLNSITVQYIIKNEGNREFDGGFYFLTDIIEIMQYEEASETEEDFKVTYYSNPNGEMLEDILPRTLNKRNFSVTFNGRKISFQIMKDKKITFDREILKKIDIRKKNWKRHFNGITMALKIRPGERGTIMITYTQTPEKHIFIPNSAVVHFTGYKSSTQKNENSPTHYHYKYLLYPLKTFTGGVDSLVIRTVYPTEIRNFHIDPPLDIIKKDKKTIVREKHFKSIPEDTVDISIKTHGAYNRFGATLTPYLGVTGYSGQISFGSSLSLDYNFLYGQIGAGVFWATIDHCTLYQEYKFYLPWETSSFMMLFDMRVAVGFMQKVSPYRELGFRFAAGFRIAMFSFELVYHYFPPILSDRKSHDIYFSMPFGF